MLFALLLAILACGLGIRLIAISQPFIDAWSWRQADVAMVAENVYRTPDATLFVAACLTTSLANLVKPPAVAIGVPMLVMVWGK